MQRSDLSGAYVCPCEQRLVVVSRGRGHTPINGGGSTFPLLRAVPLNLLDLPNAVHCSPLLSFALLCLSESR